MFSKIFLFWSIFFLENPKPFVEQILQYGRELMADEGIRVNY